MERPASRSAPITSRQSRRRPPPFKPCAASIRRRSYPNSFLRFSKFARRNNLFYERFKPRIAVQSVEQRINFDEPDGITRAILISFSEPAKRRLFVPEAEINEGKAISRYVSLFRQRLQLIA